MIFDIGTLMTIKLKIIPHKKPGDFETRTTVWILHVVDILNKLTNILILIKT